MVRLVLAAVALLKSSHKIICFSKQKSCPCVPMLQKQRIPPTCHIVDQYSHRCTITKDKLSIMQMYPILSNFSCGIQDWKCHCQNSGCSLKTGSCDSMGVLLVFKLFLIAIENQKKIVLIDLSYFVKTKLPFTLFLLSPFAAAPMQMKFPCLYLVLTLHKKKVTVPSKIDVCFRSHFSLLIEYLGRILVLLWKREILYEKLRIHFTSSDSQVETRE